MTKYDEARVRVVMELITEGPRLELLSASIADAGGDNAKGRAMYFNRRVDQVLSGKSQG